MSQLPSDVSKGLGLSSTGSKASRRRRIASASASASASSASLRELSSPVGGGGDERQQEADVPWKRLVLRLCLFHALLLERRQYQGLGWRQPYEFSAADFLAAIKQVRSIDPMTVQVDPQRRVGSDLTLDLDLTRV